MKLLFITNNSEIAKYVCACGVDRVFVDLEQIGKQERQGHLNTHKAFHQISDISPIRKNLSSDKEVLVRCNPIHQSTSSEIERIIDAGADVIMLPMFKSAFEVETFLKTIGGRCQTNLLLETAESLARLDHILEFKDQINEIHIGLNDLHLSMNLAFMFELLSEGIVEYLSKKIVPLNIDFGFGGIATIGQGAVPAEYILGEHVRLNSNSVILSRSFHLEIKDLNELEQKLDFPGEIQKLRSCHAKWTTVSKKELRTNQEKLRGLVRNFVMKKANS